MNNLNFLETYIKERLNISADNLFEEINIKRSDIEAALKIAEIMGLNVKFIRPLIPAADIFNGCYLNDTIYINTNASNPSHVVLGHEIMEKIYKSSPEMFKEFLGLFKEELDHKLFEYYKNNLINVSQNIDDNLDIYKEAAADYSAEQFNNPDFWIKLNKEAPGVLENIINTIRDFIEKIKTIIKPEYQVLKFLKDTEKVEEAYSKLIKNTTPEKNKIYGHRSDWSIRSNNFSDNNSPLLDKYNYYEDESDKDWLQDRKSAAYAKSITEKYPYMGEVTGGFHKSLFLDPKFILGNTSGGLRNEHINIPTKLEAKDEVETDRLNKLTESMKRFGYNDLDDPIFINVGHDGRAWINEGNHRVRSAINAELPLVPVDVRYFDGGERFDTPWKPDNITDTSERNLKYNKDLKIGGVSISYSLKKYSNPFYSKLLNVIEVKAPNKITAQDLMGLIKSNQIKDDEIKWSGINDFIENKEGKIDKIELINFLKCNQIEIKEIIKGNDLYKELNDKLQKYRAELQGIMKDGDSSTKITFALTRQSLFNQNDPILEKYSKSDINKIDRLIGKITKIEGELDQDEYFTAYKESDTKYQKYTLPDGENYKEILFSLMDKRPSFVTWLEGEKHIDYYSIHHNFSEKEMLMNEYKTIYPDKRYSSSHWSEMNVLAHARIQDFTDKDGEKILFIEEIQSDWHQEGRKKGYENLSKTNQELNNKGINYVKTEHEAFVYKNSKGEILTPDPSFFTVPAVKPTEEQEAAIEAHKKALKEKEIPAAPFSKTWHEFVLKNMIRYAAQNNYDKIAWATGEQQIERYDLSKQIDSICYNVDEDKYNIYAFKNGEKVISKERLIIKEVEELVGKDIAKRIENDEGKFSQTDYDDYYKLSGVDLKVGGEGMKGFYDKIIPEYLNKYCKKWGCEVENTNIEIWNPKLVLKDVAIENFEKGNKVYIAYEDGSDELIKSTEDFNGLSDLDKFVVGDDHKYSMNQKCINITREMKRSVLYEGQPLFSLKRDINKNELEIFTAEKYLSEKDLKSIEEIYSLEGKKLTFKEIQDKYQDLKNSLPENDPLRKAYYKANYAISGALSRESMDIVSNNIIKNQKIKEQERA